MNRILLDTCVFLWWQADAERLTDEVRRAIQDADEVFVSVASAWEIAIKLSTGKLEIPEPVSESLGKYGLLNLSITIAHAELAGALPLHHRDPFDRMLVAQARVEHLVLATSDAKFRPYAVPCLWV